MSNRAPTIETAIFDYGGVLTTPMRDSFAAWFERDNIDPASFSKTLKAWLGRSAPDSSPIRRLEIGELSADEFNVVFGAELRAKDGSAIAAGDHLKSLFAEMRSEPSMFDLVSELQSARVKVALLSNSWGNFYAHDPIVEAFDVVVISGQVGMRKPNPDIFEYTLNLLGVRAENAIFVDDATVNIEGAERVGIRSVLHVNPQETRRQLSQVFEAITTDV